MLRSSRSVPTTQASGGGGWDARWLLVVRCNTPGEAPEVVEARKTWFVPGARSAIPGHEELGLVRTCAGHGKFHGSSRGLGHGSTPK